MTEKVGRGRQSREGFQLSSDKVAVGALEGAARSVGVDIEASFYVSRRYQAVVLDLEEREHL